MESDKKLRRISGKGWLGGVCAGFAYYFEMPVWAVRLIWTFFVFAGIGSGALLYALFWIFMPNMGTPDDYEKITS